MAEACLEWLGALEEKPPSVGAWGDRRRRRRGGKVSMKAMLNVGLPVFPTLDASAFAKASADRSHPVPPQKGREENYRRRSNRRRRP